MLKIYVLTNIRVLDVPWSIAAIKELSIFQCQMTNVLVIKCVSIPEHDVKVSYFCKLETVVPDFRIIQQFVYILRRWYSRGASRERVGNLWSNSIIVKYICILDWVEILSYNEKKAPAGPKLEYYL
jgi:hypothetical protein